MLWTGEAHPMAKPPTGPRPSNRPRLDARIAILRYVHETYGPGQYRYDLALMAEPDDVAAFSDAVDNHTGNR